MHEPTRRATLGLTLATVAAGATAQTVLPDRPITITVPFPPGGPTDTLTRVVAEAMTRNLGHPVQVENVTGAGGTIGAGKVAQGPPDRSSLLMHHVGHASTAILYRRLPYHPLTSFAPIGLVTEVPQIVLARLDFPATDFRDLLATIKRDGSKLNLANAGLGGADQLGGMLLQREAGAAATTVAFRGAAPIMTELLAGRIDLYCAQTTVAVPHLRAGRLKAYAITSESRLSLPGLDTIPTVGELGHPGMRITVWHGLYAPAGTAPATVDRLSAALRAALAEPAVVARFADLATTPVPAEQATPAFHRAFLTAEIDRWRPIITEAGAFAD